MARLDFSDVMRLSSGAMRGHPLRSVLSMLGIAIGVAAVIMLTSLGEGVRRHMDTEFSEFGTNILQIHPGKTETSGMHGGVFGGTTRKLTIEDAEALGRIPILDKVIPLAIGQARVEGGGRGRSVVVYGTTSDFPEVLKASIGQGQFLAPGDPRRSSSVAVLGPKLKRELFGDANALGQFVRIAGARLRVIGVMQPKGQILGMDMDDSAYIRVATAMRLFNLEEVQEIDVLFAHEGLTEAATQAIRRVLIDRHRGEEDFTIVSQSEMLKVFGRVMDVLTLGVAVIASISLLVGSIGIFTMMWISVGERVSEIGLLRALGATEQQVQNLFLAEAILLTVLGGLAGLAFGFFAIFALRLFFPSFRAWAPVEYVVAALVLSIAVGLISGVGPARRAADLAPVDALRTE
ncbi:MAG: ABC transporter permease [Myxococcales bacterium]|nr:FtsX-like permease family protein [Myxococcales bacterium]HIK84631.1 FtsX-like permease family protein [Myxococcales bacterium]